MIIDPLTQEQFEPKRISQRFANAVNRIMWHNQKAQKLRHFESGIDKPLKKNHKICMELLPPGAEKKEAVVHKQYLLGKGFSFGIVTNYTNHNNKAYPAIYSYLLVTLENDQIKIIQK